MSKSNTSNPLPDCRATVSASGVVVFRARNERRRFVLQPAEGKRLICEFSEPVSVRVRQTVSVEGVFYSEGSQSIVLRGCSLTAAQVPAARRSRKPKE